MKQGKVYKIIHTQSDICYIGSTFNTLRDRWGKHYKTAKCAISKYLEEYGRDNFKIILIKEYEVIDRAHLEAYEQLWINKLKCINCQSAFTIKKLVKKDYRYQNKEQITKKVKEYKESNIDKINSYQKDYRAQNKEQNTKYQEEYRNSLININCDCGGIYNKKTKNRHFKSQKHLKYVQN